MAVTNDEIRESLIISYPQMFGLAQKKLEEIKAVKPDYLGDEDSIIDNFIDKAKLEHDENKWKDKYLTGCVLLTCHFLTESQNEATNSGLLVIKETQASGSANGSKSEFMRPSLDNFGEFATTKYGRQWEAIRNTLNKTIKVWSI